MIIDKEILKFTIVTILVVLAAVSDLKKRKIPNRLTVFFTLVGLGFNVITNYSQGILISIFGFFVGFLIFIIPYILKAMGAGDIKLMAALGAITGWRTILLISLFTALSGGIIVIISKILEGGIIKTFKRTWKLILFYFFSLLYIMTSFPTMNLKKQKNRIDISDERQDFIPYALAIAVGSIITMVLTRMGMIQGLSV